MLEKNPSLNPTDLLTEQGMEMLGNCVCVANAPRKGDTSVARVMGYVCGYTSKSGNRTKKPYFRLLLTFEDDGETTDIYEFGECFLTEEGAAGFAEKSREPQRLTEKKEEYRLSPEGVEALTCEEKNKNFTVMDIKYEEAVRILHGKTGSRKT